MKEALNNLSKTLKTSGLSNTISGTYHVTPATKTMTEAMSNIRKDTQDMNSIGKLFGVNPGKFK